MPEQLQPVIDVVIASFQVDTSLLIQGAIIALLVGFMMSRFGQLIYYVAIALLLDLLVVPLGMEIYANEMNFAGALDYTMGIISAHGENLFFIVNRAIFFTAAIIVVSLLKSIFRRS